MDPDDILARSRDIYKMLPWTLGTTSVPSEDEWKLIVYSMYPRGFQDKFRDVLRDQADPSETLVTITRFTKGCYDREQKTGVRISDGKPIKRNQPEDKEHVHTKSFKNQKSKKGNNNKVKDTRMI